MKNKAMEKAIFAFFDFCTDCRLASFFTIFVVSVSLAEIAAMFIQIDAMPIRILGLAIGIVAAGTAHLGFGSWFVTK